MSAILCSAVDLAGEGVGTVLDRVAGAGLDGIAVAALYHASRDLLPHNPLGPLHYGESATAFFPPDPARYPDPALVPPESSLTRGTGVLAEAVAAARDRGLAVEGWIVATHASRLASAHPGLAQVSALGGPLRHALCPAQPVVRAYAAALAADVAAFGVDGLLLESAGFADFEHGTRHERDLLGLSPVARFLAGLCWCAACLAAGDRDAEALRDSVTRALRAELDDGVVVSASPDVDRAELVAAFGPALEAHLDARAAAVAELVRAVVAAVGIPVGVVDLGGARLGYATGRPSSDARAVELSWRDGLDVRALPPEAEPVALGYVADPARLAAEVRAAAEAWGRAPRVVLRPMPPDARSREDVVTAVAAARAGGAGRVDFYHYGLMRRESLDWIRAALDA